jgi:hypothetical protein
VDRTQAPFDQVADSTRGSNEQWPALPWEAWNDTCETLHRWMQIVGKVVLALAPFLNEWWQVAFHLTARGLTTGPIPFRDGIFEMEFDFVDHHLVVRTSDGRSRALKLMPRSVADFYLHLMRAFGALGIEVHISPLPVEVPDAIPFDRDQVHAAYDPEYAHRWWLILTQIDGVLQQYRSSFVGKSSPIQFFWGSFDLCETRFSGRPATPPQGQPRFLQVAEDQENMACGFWPGNPSSSGMTLGQPAFYAYIYPEPSDFKKASVQPGVAHYDDRLGEFILLYEDVRRTREPVRTLREFFDSTYDAAATLAHWDRGLLELSPAGGVARKKP